MTAKVIDGKAFAANVRAQVQAHVAKLKSWVDACRNLRGEMKVPPSARLPLYVAGDAAFAKAAAPVLQALAKL